MKKVLFASTALVAFAGAAAAEVTLTGSAEMGIFDNDLPGVDAQFHTDIDVTFTMSGETDGGLTFGASVDLDEGGDGSRTERPNVQGGETIFISGGFGTVTMGDTDGAFDWAMTEVNLASGSIQDDETIHSAFSGNAGLDGVGDGQILRYDNTFGSFGFALSAEQVSGVDPNAGDETIIGLGVKYDLDLGGTTVGLGFGYQMLEVGGLDLDVLGVSANATFGGGFSAGLNYSTYENHLQFNADSPLGGGRFITPGADGDHLGLGIGYESGPIAVGFNYGIAGSDLANTEAEGFGLAASYDLGGGASAHFGYGYSDVEVGGVSADVSTYSIGLAMSF